MGMVEDCCCNKSLDFVLKCIKREKRCKVVVLEVVGICGGELKKFIAHCAKKEEHSDVLIRVIDLTMALLLACWRKSLVISKILLVEGVLGFFALG